MTVSTKTKNYKLFYIVYIGVSKVASECILKLKGGSMGQIFDTLVIQYNRNMNIGFKVLTIL